MPCFKILLSPAVLFNLVGDFNLPAIDWSVDQTAPVTTGGHAEDESFCDLVGDNFGQQFIAGPTHTAGNKLDLLLCNCPEIIGDVSTFTSEQCNFPTYDYTNRETLRIYAVSCYEFRLILLSQITLTNTGYNGRICSWPLWDKFIPVKTVRDTNSPPWIDGEVQHLIPKKYAALKKFWLDKSDDRKRKLHTLST